MGYIDFFKSILPSSFLSAKMSDLLGLYSALGRQFDDLEAAVNDGQNQLFIDSATYKLPVYEAEFAIKLTDSTVSDAARRNNIMAMSRGGLGATPAALTNVLQAYGYSTQILEDFPNYTVTIKFTDFKGVPPNQDDLKRIIARMIPGHLVLNWQYLYNLYGDYENHPGYTWGGMDASGLTWGDVLTKMP